MSYLAERGLPSEDWLPVRLRDFPLGPGYVSGQFAGSSGGLLLGYSSPTWFTLSKPQYTGNGEFRSEIRHVFFPEASPPCRNQSDGFAAIRSHPSEKPKLVRRHQRLADHTKATPDQASCHDYLSCDDGTDCCSLVKQAEKQQKDDLVWRNYPSNQLGRVPVMHPRFLFPVRLYASAEPIRN
jgi:hypothetical protein